MRQIKFRVWDKKERRFLTQKEMTEIGGFYYTYGVDPDPEEYVLMQFTGLKDKNGKEIYEGDVVESKDWHTDADGRCVLSDANSYMKKKVIEYRTKEPFVGFTIPSKCEVIGNIYENPELIK